MYHKKVMALEINPEPKYYLFVCTIILNYLICIGD